MKAKTHIHAWILAKYQDSGYIVGSDSKPFLESTWVCQCGAIKKIRQES